MKKLECMMLIEDLTLADDNRNVLEGKLKRYREIIGKKEFKIMSLFWLKQNLSRV